MPRIRNAEPADIPKIVELQHACYPVLATISRWSPSHLASHQHHFPEGQFVADEAGRIVGFCATFRTDASIALKPHTFRDITLQGTFDGNRPDGDTLYGAEIMVHPDFRRRGIGRAFYAARFDLVRTMGLRRFVAAGRLPGVSEVSPPIPVEEYVADVVAGRRTDRVLTPQLRSGLRVAGVLHDYLKDPASMDCASLLVWEPS